MRLQQIRRCICLTIVLIVHSRTDQLNKYPEYRMLLKNLTNFRTIRYRGYYFSGLDENSHLVENRQKENISDKNILKTNSNVRDAIVSYSNKFRTRRHYIDNVTQQHFSDQENFYNLSKLAIKLCPYADFCFANGSAINNPVPNTLSCCRDCYCDEACGERMDCCFDFLDKIRIVERNRLACITPRVVEIGKIITVFVRSYFMVDSCLNNYSYACKYEPVELWGSLYPVYSPSSKLIYYNRHCATCNGVYDTIVWNVYVSCQQTFTVKAESLLKKINNRSCDVYFKPPRKGIMDRFICHKDIISSCTTAGNWESFKEACESAKATVQVQGQGDDTFYANIFCKICNGLDNHPLDTCKSYDDGFKSISDGSFMALIRWDVVASRVSDDESLISDIKDKKVTCGKFEAKHPNKVDCRSLSCPNGAIRTTEGCKLYATTWYKQGFLLHLILTPAFNNLLPLMAFSKLTGKVNDWLDAKGISFDSIDIDAEIITDQNISYSRRLNIKVGSAKFPLKAAKLLKSIQSSLMKQWEITFDNKKYLYDVKFDKYQYYVQNGETRRRAIFSPYAWEFEPNILPKIYESVYKSRKFILFYINKLYFCEQVDLHPDEWIQDYQGIRLNLTGNGKNKFLGDAEFNYQLGPDGEWKIQICVEDFNLESAVTRHLISFKFFSALSLIHLLWLSRDF